MPRVAAQASASSAPSSPRGPQPPSAAATLASLTSVDGCGIDVEVAPQANSLHAKYPRPLDLSQIFLSYATIGDRVTHHALRRFRATKSGIERYVFLRDLQLFNPRVYFALLLSNTEELLPSIYTPVVGEACQAFHQLPMLTQGLYISLRDRGRILAKLRAWKQQHVRVIVATDRERILGLGDLGANGMGISEGKIQLYTAAAGVDPSACLPVCLDVGTNNAALRADPRYRGLRQARATGEEYDAFVDEFMTALRAWQPHVLLQFEDFANTTAFKLLERYQATDCTFNDDIQGTACITLAGILSALRATGTGLGEATLLFYGAGEAGTGIGELVAQCLVKQAREAGRQLSIEDARKRCFFMDSKGLVCAERPDAACGALAPHKRPFAHAVPHVAGLAPAVAALRPSILVGVSTVARAFDRGVVEAMAALNSRPIIFPLSNPTSKSECTFDEAWEWSAGRVLFASGSPFPARRCNGLECHPAQANNAYVFPAVGHAAVLTRAASIPNETFLVAAEALASMTSLEQVSRGYLFPPFSQIRGVSTKLMAAVAAYLVDAGLGTQPAEFNGDWAATCAAAMWDMDCCTRG